MQRNLRLVLAAALSLATLAVVPVPALGHEVNVNQPNCNSLGRVAEKLTGDRANREHFERTGQGQFFYQGPEVEVNVKRDYIVYGFGGTLVQHDQATLSQFRAVCLPRLEVPYTYWPPQDCLDGVQSGDRPAALAWVSNSLGGRSQSWQIFGFFRGTAVFEYDGPRVLFSVPKDALVWPITEDEYEPPVTPGYEVWEESFRLTCYGS